MAEDVRGKAGVVLISKGTTVVAQVMPKLHQRLVGLLFLLLQGGDATVESGSGLMATVVD